MRVAIKFAYNGKTYSGYARQPNLKTIEGELIKGLIKHGFIEDTSESKFRSASRTDKHVSALCNVIAFNTNSSKKQILDSLSEEFEDIFVYGVSEVDSHFNPRYAKFRHYRYYLDNTDLDFKKAVSTLACFTGEHDFSNFARVEEFRDSVRVIDNIFVTDNKGFFVVDFFAQTFLWHQIRRIISAVQKVELGKFLREDIVEALSNPDKVVDFGLAAAEPLVLMDIVYDFEFEYDKKMLNKVKQLEKDIMSF